VQPQFLHAAFPLSHSHSASFISVLKQPGHFISSNNSWRLQSIVDFGFIVGPPFQYPLYSSPRRGKVGVQRGIVDDLIFWGSSLFGVGTRVAYFIHSTFGIQATALWIIGRRCPNSPQGPLTAAPAAASSVLGRRRDAEGSNNESSGAAARGPKRFRQHPAPANNPDRSASGRKPKVELSIRNSQAPLFNTVSMVSVSLRAREELSSWSSPLLRLL
jgi:hypothetical protein